MGLVTFVRRRRARRRFRDLREEASRTGKILCGTFTVDGEPVYWLEKPDVPESTVAETAFRHRYGRPLSGPERLLMSLMERTRAED